MEQLNIGRLESRFLKGYYPFLNIIFNPNFTINPK
jgi:hypothetical protein